MFRTAPPRKSEVCATQDSKKRRAHRRPARFRVDAPLSTRSPQFVPRKVRALGEQRARREPASAARARAVCCRPLLLLLSPPRRNRRLLRAKRARIEHGDRFVAAPLLVLRERARATTKVCACICWWALFLLRVRAAGAGADDSAPRVVLTHARSSYVCLSFARRAPGAAAPASQQWRSPPPRT